MGTLTCKVCGQNLSGCTCSNRKANGDWVAPTKEQEIINLLEKVKAKMKSYLCATCRLEAEFEINNLIKGCKGG